MIDLKGKKVLVIGLGLSGRAAAGLLLREGAKVTVRDDGTGPDLKKNARPLRNQGATVKLGEDGVEEKQRFDLVVLSPGVPPDHPLVRWAEERKVPAIGEVELASHFLDCPIVAVTGTNGKTTTVSLIAEMLKDREGNCRAGGNIGMPLSQLAVGWPRPSLVAAEISSFQLERTENFQADTAVFLNLSADHLDRHPDLKAYRNAKLRLFRNQRKGARALLPARPPAWLEGGVPPEVEKFYWGGRGLVFRSGKWLKGRSPRAAPPQKLCRIDRIKLPGDHNLDNIMAASAAALLHGAGPETVGRVAETFVGLPHRLEYLLTRGGVKFYNDSKATNPGAVEVALRAFQAPVVWIAGGSDKGLDFSGLRSVARRSVKLAIFLGETGRKLEEVFSDRIPCRLVANLPEAVSLAWREASSGDTVLLAPGCASFDMFRDYRQRGETFKALVNELPGRKRKN